MKRLHLLRHFLSLTSLLVLTTCSDGDPTLEIRFVSSPNGSCTFSGSDNTGQPRGFYDPQGTPSYTLPLNIRNNLQAPSTDPAVIEGNVEVRTQTNDIKIVGFDACWFRGDLPSVAAFNSFEDGSPIDCEDLPAAQRGFLPSSAIVEQDGGTSVAVVQALPLSALQAPGIFGPDYNPDNSTSFSSDFNGTPVIIQLRAVGQLPTNRTVRSAFYVFPIDVCTGCVQQSCAARGLVPNQTVCLAFSIGNIACTTP